MPTLSYLHLDVFTDRLFGGNQLAVYLDPPADLRSATMQSIAREMNFSETTFVYPARRAGCDWHVRIFTPASELPIAGHPTIGTAFALAEAGFLTPGTAGTVFLEGVGPIPLSLEWSESRLAFAWMTQPQPVFGPTVDAVAEFAAAVSLAPADLCPNGWPVQQVSCGVPFVIIPVASRAALDRAAPAGGAYPRAFEAAGLPHGHVYLFTLDRGADGADVYTRMFAPDIGIVEDPATGSASGPLGAYLVHHGLVAPGPIRNLQGVALGRPSWIHIAPVTGTFPSPGPVPEIAAMRVGGSSVVAGKGWLYLQE